MKIKNKLYREMLDKGIIQFVGPEQLTQAFNNIKGKNINEGKALLITLYYTGARPNEVLKLKAKDCVRNGRYLDVHLVGSKGGLPRVVKLCIKFEFVKELFKYVNGLFPDTLLFFHYCSIYKRKIITKKGEVRERHEITDKLGYHFKKWFIGIFEGSLCPYYLRHNRFSKLAEKGATDHEIMQMKGSKTIESIRPYKHLSTHTSEKLARMND